MDVLQLTLELLVLVPHSGELLHPGCFSLLYLLSDLLFPLWNFQSRLELCLHQCGFAKSIIHWHVGLVHSNHVLPDEKGGRRGRYTYKRGMKGLWQPIDLIQVNHGIVHRREPFALHETLPILPSDAFVHPLEWEAKAGGKTTKVIFNIYNPPLIINI